MTILQENSSTTSAGASASSGGLNPTSILHRTTWRPPVAVSADGMYIQLEDGRRVIDAVGGAAVSCIGNGHPDVTKAMKDQIDTVSYVYNMQLSNKPAEELAKYMVSTGKGAFESVVFVSGGSEAMEAVLKLARQYFYETKQHQRSNFIARQLSFHGNTLGTLALAYHPARRAPYVDLLNKTNFHHVSPAYAKRFQKPEETEEEYVERLRQELEDKFQELGPDTVIGFVAETVVGATSGVVPPPKGYLTAMKSVCDKYGALFILDEVMSGMGRLGTTHAWETFGDGAIPDLQAVAKGLGGGYATIGAVLMSKRVTDGIRDSAGFMKHGHTYQAHPVSCAASLAVQSVVDSQNLLANSLEQGELLSSLLRTKLTTPNSPLSPYVFDIRGRGAWWAVEFEFAEPKGDAKPLQFKGGESFAMLVQAKCLEKGLVIMAFHGGANLEGTKGDHIMFSPAYNVTKEQTEKIVEIFIESAEEVFREDVI
ncbi:hypothetical protein NLI96_g9263 [Meripilus lineatus]|uniref:PLP-dependent transferase n=1 Tax=Meripilus lineatus TaxID=2056292 RepID=A0AAD5UXE4_9APHY|nr:hypothetical protein NLI96_g9263 [Physisporinus lineatus]